jgi:hypothetical protein
MPGSPPSARPSCLPVGVPSGNSNHALHSPGRSLTRDNPTFTRFPQRVNLLPQRVEHAGSE